MFIDRTSITDLTCLNSNWLDVLPGVGAVLLLFFLLTALGRLVGGQRRWAPADTLTGWGVLTLILTLWGLFVPLPLSEAVFGVGIVAFASFIWFLWKAENKRKWLWLAVIIFLQSWVLFFLNRAGLVFWDDYAHWSPNTLFMWQHDAFPNHSLPPSYAALPGYPYAMPYLSYAASLIGGSFLVQGSAMMAWLMLVYFGWVLFQSFRDLNGNEKVQSWIVQPAWLFLAVIMVSVFNPGFNASFSVTGGSDLATSVAVGVFGLLLMQFYIAIKAKDASRLWALGFQIAMAAVVLMMLRQMNIVLVGLFYIGFLLLLLKDKMRTEAILILVITIIPAFLVRWGWQDYIIREHPEGTVGIHAFKDWHCHLLPAVMRAAVEEALEKWGFFLLMAVVSGVGIRGFFRSRTPYNVLCFLAAVLFLGNLAYLFTAYMGASSFTEHELKGAASFYRYNTHVGFLGVAALWFALQPYLERKISSRRQLIGLTAFGLCLLPILFVLKPQWIVPQARPELCEDRALGKRLAQSLPSPSNFVLLDPEGNGFRYYIINYAFGLDNVRRGSQFRAVTKFDEFSIEHVSEFLSQLKENKLINAVYIPPVHKKNIDPAVVSFFGLPNDKNGGLFLRHEGAWKTVHLEP